MTTSEYTSQATAAINDLERSRASAVQAASFCAHAAITLSDPRGFRGPVAEQRPGSEYNPAAHGNIEVTETCRSCKAARRVLINGRHRELGGWHPATSEIEDRLRVARSRKDWERRLDSAEQRAWDGDLLRLAGVTPVRIQIGTYADASDHVDLTVNGDRRCYTLAEIEGAQDDRRLDDAQRVAWGLIVRRCRRAVAAAHGRRAV